MELQKLVMPQKCTRCGSVFDLQYDYDEGDFKGDFFCWKCRAFLAGRELEDSEVEEDFFDELA